MPVYRTRISTSLMPITGSAISSSQRPGCSLLLTNAFINCPPEVQVPHEVVSQRQWTHTVPSDEMPPASRVPQIHRLHGNDTTKDTNRESLCQLLLRRT